MGFEIETFFIAIDFTFKFKILSFLVLENTASVSIYCLLIHDTIVRNGLFNLHNEFLT